MNSAPRAGSLRFAFSQAVLRRNASIALVVGTVLSIANQYDVVLREPMSARLAAKILFNFVIPFLVSSVSAALNRRDS